MFSAPCSYTPHSALDRDIVLIFLVMLCRPFVLVMPVLLSFLPLPLRYRLRSENHSIDVFLLRTARMYAC
jgi:hypothetical protein